MRDNTRGRLDNIPGLPDHMLAAICDKHEPLDADLITARVYYVAACIRATWSEQDKQKRFYDPACPADTPVISCRDFAAAVGQDVF